MSGVFQVDHLSKAFGGLTVSRDISLSMNEGARLALIGPNGAGKTTFVNLVTGQLRPDAGTIWLGGEDVTRVGSVHRVRKGLVRTFQVTRLFADMTPEEHLTLTILQREGRASRILGRFRRDAEVAGEVESLLVALGLIEVARRKVGEIAYGQQRLLEIALALALKPKVLLLDEPAAGVPQSETPRIEQALERLPPSLAVLMIEHDMDLVFRFARHVVVLAAGEIIFEGIPSEVAADARVREAYLGNYADARSTLEVRSLSAGYGPTIVLEDLSFSVKAGEQSLRARAQRHGQDDAAFEHHGSDAALRRRDRINGEDISPPRGSARSRRGVGLVPQDARYLPLAHRGGKSARSASRTVPRNIDRGGLCDVSAAGRNGGGNIGCQLSGGEQQMLSTARAILGRPSLLLLDEPLEGLAPVICDELMEALTLLASRGDMTIVLVEQRLEAALDFAQTVLLLERGRAVWSGTSAELRGNGGLIENYIGVGTLH